jgi:hypothetical protein
MYSANLCFGGLDGLSLGETLLSTNQGDAYGCHFLLGAMVPVHPFLSFSARENLGLVF